MTIRLSLSPIICSRQQEYRIGLHSFCMEKLSRWQRLIRYFPIPSIQGRKIISPVDLAEKERDERYGPMDTVKNAVDCGQILTGANDILESERMLMCYDECLMKNITLNIFWV